MLEFILAVIIVIGSIGAVAEGAEGLAAGHTRVEKCVALVSSAVDGEDVPAAIEACYDDSGLKNVLACSKVQGFMERRSCVRDEVL